MSENSPSEQEFLASYRASDYPNPIVMVDSALFTLHEDRLKVLLVQRADHPHRGRWGLPGGFVDLDDDQDLVAAAVRSLQAKTGVRPPYVEQLGAFGSTDRDPRGWSVTICYTALIAHQRCEAMLASVTDADWFPLQQLPSPLAFDHRNLIRAANERLRQKALYSIIPAYALPKEFTLPELQHLHELLIGKPLQKKSFRRRIEQADLLIDTGRKRTDAGRPAVLYRLKSRTRDHTFVRNLEA